MLELGEVRLKLGLLLGQLRVCGLELDVGGFKLARGVLEVALDKGAIVDEAGNGPLVRLGRD